jgi:hypothetical protein
MKSHTFSMRGAKTIVIAFCIAILCSESADAIDGNSWKRLGRGEQYAYIMGVLDTWGNVAQLINVTNPKTTGPTERMFMKHVECADKMEYAQLVAIVDKFMADNPSQWHYSMPSIVSTAVSQACQKK